jgi:hypothetical protein
MLLLRSIRHGGEIDRVTDVIGRSALDKARIDAYHLSSGP